MKLAINFFIFGLALGIGPCLVSCGPLLISYLVGTNKKIARSISAYLLFSLSRVFIYVCLSLFIFIFGELIVKYKLGLFSRYIFISAGVFIIIIGLLVCVGGNDLGTVAKCVIPCHSESEGRRISTLNRFFTSFRMTKNGILQQATKQCCQKLHKFFLSRDTKTVVIFGLIIGLLPCAPLISVISYIGLASKQWMDSVVYSISFGLGTMVSPLFLLILSGRGISKIFQSNDKLLRILNIICGLIIIFLGTNLVRGAF